MPDPFYDQDFPDRDKESPYVDTDFSAERISALCFGVQYHNFSSYCKNRNGQCRFSHPRKLSIFTKLQIKEKRRSTGFCFNVSFPRNHERVSNFNPNILNILSANTDIQPILDPISMICYLHKLLVGDIPPVSTRFDYLVGDVSHSVV